MAISQRWQQKTVDWQISCFHAIVSGVFTECLPAVVVSSQQQIYDPKTPYLFFLFSRLILPKPFTNYNKKKLPCFELVLTEFTSVEFSSQEKQNKKKKNVTDLTKVRFIYLGRVRSHWRATREHDQREKTKKKKTERKERKTKTKLFREKLKEWTSRGQLARDQVDYPSPLFFPFLSESIYTYLCFVSFLALVPLR